jgi:hypothetical protein
MVASYARQALPQQGLGLELRNQRRHLEEGLRRSTSVAAVPIPLYPAQPGAVVTTAAGAATLLYRGRFLAMSSGILINMATWTHYGGAAPFAQGSFYAQAIDSDSVAYNASTLVVGPTGSAPAAAPYLRGITIPIEQIGELIVINFFGHLAAGGAGSNVSAAPYYCMNCPPDLAANPV